MRGIQSTHNTEKEQRRNYRILGVLLIFLMLGSTLGYAFSLLADSTTQTTTPGEPYYDGNGWLVSRGGAQFYLLHGPEEVRNVTLDVRASLSDFMQRTVYISASEPTVQQELTQPLAYYAQRVQPACYGACENPDLPEKNCSDTIIVWTNSATNRVWQQDSCTFIEGDTRAVDAYIYYLYGYL